MYTEVEREFLSLFPDPHLDRRGFMRASVGVGFAAAVSPVVAQTAIKTDTSGLVAGGIDIKTAKDTIPGYRAKPATGSKFPVVLVVSEIFGVHEHIADICRRLAKLGYYAIAPELFVREGDVKNKPGIKEVLEVVMKVSDEAVYADLDASVAHAQSDGGDTTRLAVTGFCWGGRIVWMYAAHNPGLKAGIAWYGRLAGGAEPAQPVQPVDVAARLHAPVLGLYGGQDQGIPLDTVGRMKAGLAAGNTAAKASEFVVYPDAPHAFHADYRPSYRKEAAEDGWKRMLAWLRKNGV